MASGADTSIQPCMSVAQQRSPLVEQCALIAYDFISTDANVFLEGATKLRIS
jgi:hypothetical protein